MRPSQATQSNDKTLRLCASWSTSDVIDVGNVARAEGLIDWCNNWCNKQKGVHGESWSVAYPMGKPEDVVLCLIVVNMESFPSVMYDLIAVSF